MIDQDPRSPDEQIARWIQMIKHMDDIPRASSAEELAQLSIAACHRSAVEQR